MFLLKGRSNRVKKIRCLLPLGGTTWKVQLFFQYLLYLLGYSFGPLIVLSWFLIKVRPKFPSALSIALIVVFSTMVILFVDTILEFSIMPLNGLKAISIGQGFKISIIEETMKILGAILGILIAREESAWTDTKLTLALFSGLIFGIFEWESYVSNKEYTPLGATILFLSRLIPPVYTITLMAGIILLIRGKRALGALIAVSPYVTHALYDHYLSMKSYLGAYAFHIVTLGTFVVGIYILLPIIREEQRTRTRFKEEATLNIEEHWLKKLG